MRSYQISELIEEKITGEWGDDPIGEDDVAVIRTANFTNLGTIDYRKVVFRNVTKKKIAAKRLKSGDIIIEKSGGSPTQPVGRVVIFERESPEAFLCNNFTTALRPKRDLVFPKYLLYSLSLLYRTGRVLRHQNKTTGIINLKLDRYLQEKVNLPPLDDQKRIAHLLGKVEGLIAQRKQHLQQLDALLKSVFLEMFGDPVKNEKGWEKCVLSNGVKIQGGYAFKSGDIIDDGGVKLVKISNVHVGNLQWDDVSYLPSQFGTRYHEYLLRHGDLLIALTRPVIKSLSAVKMVLVREDDLPCLLNQRVGRFLVNSSKLNVVFIREFCSTQYFKSEINKLCSQALQPNVSTSQIEAIVAIFPPLLLQNQFAVIVEKVEGLKGRYQKSLADLEALYGALSQKAFAGELDLSRVRL